jgi:uncharacterized membrane protein
MSRMDATAPRRGVKTKLLGVVLVFLGVLDSMLAWRGGYALPDFPVALMAIGVFLYLVGAVRQRKAQ